MEKLKKIIITISAYIFGVLLVIFTYLSVISIAYITIIAIFTPVLFILFLFGVSTKIILVYIPVLLFLICLPIAIKRKMDKNKKNTIL